MAIISLMPQTVPDTMRAVVLTGHGGLDKLEYHEDWPTPQSASDEVLLKVAACGLNNTDINTRAGWYSPVLEGATATGAKRGFIKDADDAAWGGATLNFPRIQGADVCGTVAAIGAEAPDELLGKRVLVDTWLRDWNDPLNRDKCRYFGSECNGGKGTFKRFNKAIRLGISCF